jgi:hypothetical protein
MRRQLTTQAQRQVAVSPLRPSLTRSVLQRKCDCGQHTIGGQPCGACNRESGQKLQRTAISSVFGDSLTLKASDALRPSSQTPDVTGRAFAQSGFGFEFSHVALHSDTKQTSYPAQAPASITGWQRQSLNPPTISRMPAKRESRSINLPAVEFMQSWADGNETEEEKKEAPKEIEKPGDSCKGIIKEFKGGKGSVHFYPIGGQNMLQAGKTLPKEEKKKEVGAMYQASVLIEPENCLEVQFVQNVKEDAVITFKDGSKLKKETPWTLDTKDPYPSHPAPELSKDNVKAFRVYDAPGMSTVGVDGEIGNISIKDEYRLFLMGKIGEDRKTIGMAEWYWEAMVVTTDKENKNAPLRLGSSNIGICDGEESSAEPLGAGSTNIIDQKFDVVGEAESTAARWESVFNKTRK